MSEATANHAAQIQFLGELLNTLAMEHLPVCDVTRVLVVKAARAQLSQLDASRMALRDRLVNEAEIIERISNDTPAQELLDVAERLLVLVKDLS